MDWTPSCGSHVSRREQSVLERQQHITIRPTRCPGTAIVFWWTRQPEIDNKIFSKLPHQFVDRTPKHCPQALICVVMCVMHLLPEIIHTVGLHRILFTNSVGLHRILLIDSVGPHRILLTTPSDLISSFSWNLSSIYFGPERESTPLLTFSLAWHIAAPSVTDWLFQCQSTLQSSQIHISFLIVHWPDVWLSRAVASIYWWHASMKLPISFQIYPSQNHTSNSYLIRTNL